MGAAHSSVFFCFMQILRCVRIAISKVEELTAAVREALDAQEVSRIARRVRRHAAPPVAVFEAAAAR